MRQLSIIIPTLNEADNILPLLKKIASVSLSHGLQPEVIFVDDDSTDGTRQRIVGYSGDLDVHLIHRENKRGLAGAVIEGARVATKKWVVVMDADLSHPPEAIPLLLEPLETGSHDMVIGSRYVVGGETPGWPIVRKISSRLAAVPARLITSVRDPLSGFFAVSRERLSSIDSNLPGFKIGLEVLAQAGSSFRVVEQPISFRDRCTGISKMNPTILQEYFRQLCRLSLKQPLFLCIPLFLATGIFAGLLDYVIFSFLTKWGYTLETSHMFSLLLSVHICYPIMRRYFYRKIATPVSGDYFRFLTAVLMGLFLRGGLLASPLLSQATITGLLPLFLILTTCAVWMAAMIIIRFGILQLNEVRNWKLFCSLFIGYTILLHLAYLGSTELIQEEAYYWNYSQHMATGYLDHPPMVALLIRFGTELFGNNEFGVRIGAFCCWFITAFFAYKFAERLYSRETALRAVTLAAILPIFFGTALVSTPDAPLIACWSGTLYFLYRALVQQHTGSWFGVGICLGLGLASKYTIAFLGPAIVLYMLFDSTSRKWFFKPQPYIAALLACAIFSPVIWWNYQHDWASFLFQSQGRLQAQSEFSTHKLLASILILLTPTGFLAAIASLRPRSNHFEATAHTVAEKSRRDFYFCLIMTVIPLSILILFSLTKEIKLNWTGPLWLAILPFMAYSMVHSEGKLQRSVVRLWPKTLVTLVLLYGLMLHYCALGLPGVSFAKSDFLFGEENLAQQVEKEVRAVASKDGEYPLVVGMDHYRTASGLGFYLQKQMTVDQAKYPVAEMTGRHLFGLNDLMYSYWYPPEEAAGRDILVVSQNRQMLDPSYFSTHYRYLGPIHEISIDKRGKKVGNYFYRMLNRYSPNGHQDLVTNEVILSKIQKERLAKNGSGI